MSHVRDLYMSSGKITFGYVKKQLGDSVLAENNDIKLLVKEAGGTITDFKGNPWTMEQNYFVASNGVAHSALLQLVKVV